MQDAPHLGDAFHRPGVAARRRAVLSALLPCELLVVPAGNPKVRADDTDYPFRPSSDYVYLTGDQSRYPVMVLESGADGEHRAVAYLLPRSDRESGEFWRDYYGELWDGRRSGLPRTSGSWACPTVMFAR